MIETRSHKIVANRIAKKFKTEYNSGHGADIRTPSIAVVVVAPQVLAHAPRQLRGHKKPVFIAGTNKEAVKKALEYTQGTSIGVMDNRGKIIKPSTRRSPMAFCTREK